MADYFQRTARNQQEMDAWLSLYAMRGFTLVHRTSMSAVVVKRKEFSTLMLAIGLFLFLIPLFIYLLVYIFERDIYVQITLVPDPLIGLRSDDGRWWWDGSAWQPIALALPAIEPAPIAAETA